MTTILVTGGAGFIGSHLVERLLSDGYAVTVLDNLSTGKLENLPVQHPALTVVADDICNPEAVAHSINNAAAVIHLAAVASVPASIADTLGVHQSNLVGTLQLLEAARRYGAPRFIYASSAAVYGQPLALPLREDSVLNPLSPYAIDKLASEHYLRFYAHQYGFQGVCLRFFNIYGPRQDPASPYSGVISIFADQLLAGEPITVFGDGRQSRDFVYVSDLVAVLRHALTMPLASANLTLNVGTGRQSTLMDLVAALEALTGRSCVIQFADQRSGDIRHSVADNSRLSQHLGAWTWTPLQDGLACLLP